MASGENGVALDYRVARTPVGQLHFDPENPRLPPSVDSQDESSIVSFFIDDASLLELASSIATQGFFPGEPVLVCPRPEDEDATQVPEPTDASEYTVVEGNRRLAAVKLLTDPSLAPTTRRQQTFETLRQERTPPADLPTIIFATRDAILDYLGYRHITGIKEWDPLAKARYLENVRDRRKKMEQPSSLRDLGRLIGSNAPYVGRLLAGLQTWRRLTERDWFAQRGLDPDTLPFSLFTTALNHDPLVSYMGFAADDPSLEGIDDANVEDIAEWLYVKRPDTNKTALEDSHNFKLLDEVVKSGDAIAALKGGERIRRAAILALDPSRIFSEALAEGQRQLVIAERYAGDIHEATSDDEAALIDIEQRARGLLGAITNGGPPAKRTTAE
jgi:hypothetical protein